MKSLVITFTLATAFTLLGKEYHVSVQGNDAGDGSKSKPFKSISAAALSAQSGDVITVHQGIYRERVSPPRGGQSDTQRIVYQAAPGEKVVLTGSEPIKGWEKVSGDTWKVILPNAFFGSFNPYAELIHGDWFGDNGRRHHPGAVYLNGDWLVEAAHLDEVLKPASKTPLWFAQVDGVSKESTLIYAQFPGLNPNEQPVEINVRQGVFTPSKTGISYITVRGFDLRNAATPWAPPSAAQFGIVSAYWCKGWIIEDNEISYSKCCGVALGKYGDEFDNTNDAGSADPYTDCVRRALTNGWNKATVGSHLVRNNHIHHCGQTGVVGSLGCSFSTVTGNVIHDIHLHQLFGGAEMAGIKFHGAIDVVISHNHIYRCGDVAGIWLDWMAQGAQVMGNLLHDNVGGSGDIFFEMQHGPILVANNLMLSKGVSFGLNSQGIAFAQNLITGPINNSLSDTRSTPFHPAHSTQLAGLYAAGKGDSGDHRFYNNLFLAPCSGHSLDNAALPCFYGGNVYTMGSAAAKLDPGALLKPNYDVGVKLEQKADGWYLTLAEDKAWRDEAKRQTVTTDLLGKAKVSDCAYENPDGSPLRVSTDYFGKKRDTKNPFPGPFEKISGSEQQIKVWP